MANSSVLLLLIALVATISGTVNGLSCNKCGIRTSNQFPNHPECAFVPITNPKYFRDEEDCGKFYECNRGTAYEHVCSVGYAFNQQTTYCAPASKVNCSSQAPIASSSCTICQQAKESIHQHPNCRGGSEAHQLPVLFRHEKDCSKYYQCDHGTAYLVQCPAALHFNALTNVCDYPANVDCSGPVIQEQVDGVAGGYPGTNGHQGGRDPSNAPCTICEQATNVLVKHPNCNDNGRFYSPYFRHETDCSKFYQCSHGSAYEIQCPAGLNFNSRINVCDYPHNVDCSGSVIAQANEPSYPGTNGHQIGPNESCPICQQAVNVVPAHPRCKAHDGLYFRHETDCSKFFLCNHGTAYEIQCPAGLQYNARIKVCDYPRNVDCSEEGTEQSVNPSYPGTNGHQGDRINGHQGGPAQSVHPSYPGTNGHQGDRTNGHQGGPEQSVRPSYPGTNGHQGGPNESCPICQQAVNVVPAHPRCNAHDGLYFRHETDCSKFFLCNHGTAYEIQCPAGLQYNARIKVCDYPRNVDCSEEGTEQSVNPSYPGTNGHQGDRTNGHQGGPEQSVRPSYPGTNGHQGGPNESCPICQQAVNVVPAHPRCNAHDGLYFRHETDCSKFFLCNHGTAYEIQCPAGLQYNARIKVCDYPRNVDCSEEGTEQSVGPSYPGTNEHQGGPTESCPICQQAVNVVPAHPRCNVHDGLYFRHETDCSNFYYCYHGDSYEIQCPAGLHFNSRANVCDYPSNGDCQEQPSESSSPKSIDTVPGVAIHAIHPKCPAITGDQEPVYWADTRDCTCYFGCQWGCVEEFKCPAGHQWHDSKKVCIEGLSETCQQ